jgi:hypothetical protein
MGFAGGLGLAGRRDYARPVARPFRARRPHSDLDRIEQFYRFADKFPAPANRAALAEAARILALNLVQYQSSSGKPPAGECVPLAGIGNLSPERAYELYEGSRPEIPPGKKAWGAADRLDLDRVRAMAR